MSNMDLNLLPSRAKFQAVKIKLQSKVRLVLGGMIGLWVVVAAIILAMNVTIKVRLNNLNKQYQKAQADYLSMTENIVTSQRLKYKAKIVGELLDKRFEYGKAFEAAINLFPQGVVLTDFGLENQQGFKLSATTIGKSNMDLIEAKMEEINQGKNDDFSAAKMTALTYMNGGFNFSMEVSLK